jgi:hypothetical protein
LDAHHLLAGRDLELNFLSRWCALAVLGWYIAARTRRDELGFGGNHILKNKLPNSSGLLEPQIRVRPRRWSTADFAQRFALGLKLSCTVAPSSGSPLPSLTTIPSIDAGRGSCAAAFTANTAASTIFLIFIWSKLYLVPTGVGCGLEFTSKPRSAGVRGSPPRLRRLLRAGRLRLEGLRLRILSRPLRWQGFLPAEPTRRERDQRLRQSSP